MDSSAIPLNGAFAFLSQYNGYEHHRYRSLDTAVLTLFLGVARLTLPDPTVRTRVAMASSTISAIRRSRALASALAEQVGGYRR